MFVAKAKNMIKLLSTSILKRNPNTPIYDKMKQNVFKYIKG